MLLTPLTHPEVLRALGRAGHGSLVVIADANFPASTARGPNSELVYLNLAPGTVPAASVLDALLGAIPVEEAIVMAPMTDGSWPLDLEPPIWEDFRATLERHGTPLELQAIERHAFYALARTPDVALTVVSGEQQHYGNLVLRIGVRPS